MASASSSSISSISLSILPSDPLEEGWHPISNVAVVSSNNKKRSMTFLLPSNAHTILAETFLKEFWYYSAVL